MPSIQSLLAQGGFAMYAIALGSLVSLTLAIERTIFFVQCSRAAREAIARVRKALATDDRPAALAAVSVTGGPAVVRSGTQDLRDRLSSGNDIAGAADRFRRRIGAALRRGLWLQGTLGATMPFVGLYGTVVGVLGAFEDIRSSGTSGFGVVAGSISEALVTTAGGIAVAVEAVVLFNITSAWAGRIAADVALELDELVEAAGRSR